MVRLKWSLAIIKLGIPHFRCAVLYSILINPNSKRVEFRFRRNQPVNIFPMNPFQSDLFMTRILISLQVYLASATSVATFRIYMFDGLHLLLFHWRIQFGWCHLGVWPIHLRLCRLTSLITVSWLEPLQKDSSEIVLGQKMRRIMLRHLLFNE